MPVSAVNVTAVVLTQGVRAELRACLQSLVTQSPPLREIIIVNNACEALSPSLIPESAKPQIHIVTTGGNFGTAARNMGALQAQGKYIVFIDDDVILQQRNAGALVVKCLSGPRAPSAVCFKVLAPESTDYEAASWGHPRDMASDQSHSFETDSITEGAFAINASVFRQAGGFWPGIFIGEEGADLALRLLKCGASVRYDPRIACVHLHSSTGRWAMRGFYSYARSGLLIAWRHLPICAALTFVVRTAVLLFLQSLRGFRIHAGLFAAAGTLAGLCAILGGGCDRQPLDAESMGRWRDIRSAVPSLHRRIMRQLRIRSI